MGLLIILTLLVLLIIIDLISGRKSDEEAVQASELDLQEIGLPSSWDEHYNHHRPWLRLQARNQVDFAASAPGRRQGLHTLNNHDSTQ